ncbi:MAG: alkaline phosphatase family protein [Planctomycetes bacterium]|nr:alkaline phosphatase family protein [Planctomycetota bacterium]
MSEKECSMMDVAPTVSAVLGLPAPRQAKGAAIAEVVAGLAGVGLGGYSGSELLGRFADIRGDAGNGSDDDVADVIMDIADGAAPEFLIAQLGRVDDVFHQRGPSSPEVAPMLRETDARLKRLVEHLKPLEYGIIILADHGHHETPQPSADGLKSDHGTDGDRDCLVPCTWI